MNAREHVAVVCRSAGGSGSVALVARRHCAELARDFDVTLVSDIDVEGFATHVVTPRVYDFLHRFAHVPNEIAFARAVRRALFALHARKPVSMVLTHGDVPAAVAALPFRRRTGVPFGFVTHGDMGERPRGTFDWRLSALYRWAEGKSARNADLVAALGPTMAELARRRGARAESIAIVPNGVDLRDLGIDPDAPDGRTFDATPLRLLFVGRLAVEKGVRDLAEAIGGRASRPPRAGETPALLIAGSGPLEAELRVRLDATFLGAVPRARLGALYRDADVVVVPSLSEPFGLVIVEALAAGTPVIATDVGDIAQIVRDGENGLLVPPRDPAALASAIESLARDRVLLRALASRARSSVLPRFSWEESGRRLREAVRARLSDNR